MPARFRPITRPVKNLASSLLDALLEQDCELCGMAAGESAICAACLADLPRHGNAVCPRCGDASAVGDLCGHCLRQSPHFVACHAAFVYHFPVDRLSQRLKYGGQLHLARWWAQQLLPQLATIAATHGADLIVPMPLHPSRLAERGFNQAAEIGRHLAASSGIPLGLDDCRRMRPTPPQAEMDREHRLRNVRGAFECATDLGGKHVVLLDDVMTTGASLDELARVVGLHGAASAVALVAARTLNR